MMKFDKGVAAFALFAPWDLLSLMMVPGQSLRDW